MNVTIYHNPRCSKSRQALQLLRDQGVEPTVVEYLKTPPDKQTLDRILGLLGMEPRELMRRKQKEYKDAALDDAGLTRDALLQAMLDQPILIERPIVLSNGRAALGRPPQNVLGIL